jgi:hypothetical protein
MDAELAEIAQPQTRCDNPHSGVGFNSIQVTVRKMIHVQQLDAAPEQDYDVGFFFEYEIQLMDEASYQRSLSGPASHEAYKKRQVDTARTRVFGRELIRWIDSQPTPERCAARGGAGLPWGCDAHPVHGGLAGGKLRRRSTRRP